MQRLPRPREKHVTTRSLESNRVLQRTSEITSCSFYLQIALMVFSIKKAYRRKALELHPDRNYGDVENATKLFAEVQTANEVLSDPQERAWYDSHREQILRGDDDGQDEHFEHSVRLTSATDIVKLMSKFNSSVPFTDHPNGFYGALAHLFETLAEEERLACEWDGLEYREWPEFGSSSSKYEDIVRPFYSTWIGFGTKKSYSWKDCYRPKDSADRFTRRHRERHNQRLRDQGKAEFNDAVRSLVAFVRKRDPRYIPNTQTEAERQNILRDAAAAQRARSRAANKAKLDEHVVPEWAQTRDFEDQDLFSDSEESEESEVEHINCVVCNKTFKSEKQYEAHEKSKKHVKAVQQLKRQMQKENKDLNLDRDIGSGTSTAYSTPPTNTVEEFCESEPEEDGPIAGAPTENLILGNPLQSTTKEDIQDESVENLANTTANTSIMDDWDPVAKPKLGKAKAKREKRAARQEEEEEKQGGFEVILPNFLLGARD